MADTAVMIGNLRTQRDQEKIESVASIIQWGDDDYAVVCGVTRIGRIYKRRLPAGTRWLWFLQVEGTPPPITGEADNLDKAKIAIAARYEAVRS
jgi:hypothetical protein